MGGLLPPQALVIDKNVRQEWRFHHIAVHLLCIIGLKGFGIWTFSFGDVGEQIDAVFVGAKRLTILGRILLGIGHCDLSCCCQL